MSVTTEADRLLESAKEHIKLASKELTEFVDVDNEYKESYIDTIEDILVDLRKIKRRLK